MAWVTSFVLLVSCSWGLLLTQGFAVVRDVQPGGLSQALAEASDGDLLRLAPGVYAGPLVLERAVRIEGGPGVVVEGNGRDDVVVIAASDVALSEVTIRGAGADLSQDDAAVLIQDVERVTVARCRVEARAFGIYLRGGGGHRILDNTVQGDAALPIARRGNGIHLWATARNDVRGNHLSDVRDGIYLSFAHDNMIAENEASSLRYGIHYMYSERNTLDGNRLDLNTGGIALMFSMGNTIRRNQTNGNRDFGILCLQLERSLVTGNIAEANGRGFFLENSARNRFVANEIAANGVGVFITAGSEANAFTRNDFRDNLVQVYQDHAGENDWSEEHVGNRWSDYVGFDWNGDGIGDVPYRLQTASSTLIARHPIARWLWRSPALALLDWWEGSLRLPQRSNLDPHPLVTGGGPEAVPKAGRR